VVISLTKQAAFAKEVILSLKDISSRVLCTAIIGGWTRRESQRGRISCGRALTETVLLYSTRTVHPLDKANGFYFDKERFSPGHSREEKKKEKECLV